MFDLSKALLESLPPLFPAAKPKAVQRGIAARLREDAIVEKLRRMEAESGRPVTLCEFCREAGMSTATVQRRFGGWRGLRERAGLSPVTSQAGRGQVHSRDDLMAKLRELESPTGRKLTEREFCELVGVSTSTIERHCGGWRQLRAAAGLLHRSRRWKDVPLIQLDINLHRVALELGHFPTREEIDLHSRYSAAMHLKRWGSMEGLRAHYEWFVKWLAKRIVSLKQEGLPVPEIFDTTE
jgi:hypothetical protein